MGGLVQQQRSWERHTRPLPSHDRTRSNARLHKNNVHHVSGFGTPSTSILRAWQA
jgi:hypothetical protein